MEEHLKSGDIKKHLKSPNPHHDGDCSEGSEDAQVGQDIANIFAEKISTGLAGLEEIHRSTASVEGKLSALPGGGGEEGGGAGGCR